jgi:hypothetical protein
VRSRRFASRIACNRPAFLAATLLLAACSGKVIVDGSGPPGAGGSGTSTTTTTTTNSSGQPTPCEALGHAACLAAHPSCVPVYDNQCCPSCNPGACGDCADWQFHHCTSSADGCDNAPSCGRVLMEHCSGLPAECGNTGGSPSPCGLWPGCTFADCPIDVDCDMGSQCVPVTGNSCTNSCKSLPPPCPPEMTAEADGNCWTGICIMADVCAMP